MAGVRFTEDQRKAIDTLDRSILVAAAAGSGKTAVLVERIINIILQGKANVDEMLVVTFTKAAASEMKLKLNKAIKKKIKEDPASAGMLSAQLDRMYRAYISTFHSFAMRIIREFFYLIDMEPDFKICDEVQGTILQMDAVEELFEEGFANDDFIEGVSFREFLKRYASDRNEDGIKKAIIDNYSKLRSMPDYINWAKDRVELLNVPEDGAEDSEIYRLIADCIAEDVESALHYVGEAMEMLSDAGLETMMEKLEPDRSQLKIWCETLRNEGISEELLSEMACFKAVTLRAGKAEKADYDPIKEDIKATRDKYKKLIKDIGPNFTEPSLEDRFRELTATYEYARYYIALIERFEEIFAEKKREQNLLDFSDIEHITARILENPDVAEVVRKRFKYIFIDEYQDTNKLQEYLVSKFARPDNVFKVGDIKQSIYGFRESDPKIFMKVREDYQKESNSDAEVVDLNMNFRSNAGTIDYVNCVFEKIMPGYDDAAKLYNGLKTPAEYDLKPEIHILVDENSSDDEDAGYGGSGGSGGDSSADVGGSAGAGTAGGDSSAGGPEDNPAGIDPEAVHVARIVKSIIGTEFYDSASGCVRKATARDVVILMRGVAGHADAYYKAMLEQDITAYVNDEEGYFDTVEIEVAMSLLRVIDNMRQDVALIGVLRSEIFGFGPEELGEIRAVYKEAGGSGSYYNAFMQYIADHGETALGRKCRRARERILEWKRLAGVMQLGDFVWHVLNDSGYYLYAGAMYGGRQRQANLRVLVERAGTYQESGVVSLGGFLRYMDLLKTKNVKTGQAVMVSEEDDVVRIMTIHKSKGLEFPFVILAGIGRKLNSDRMGRGFLVDSDLGVAISYVDREQKFWRPTIMQRLIAAKASEENYQEELRVLYVAMTRARQQLILTGTVKNQEKLESKVTGRIRYIDIIRQSLQTSLNSFNVYEAEAAKQPRRVNMLDRFLDTRKRIHRDDYVEIYDEVNRRLNYVYPNIAELETKAKFSVSELRTLAEEQQKRYKTELADPEFREVREASGAEVGTGYHRIMEKVDFGKVIAGGVIDRDCAEPAHPIAVGLECAEPVNPTSVEGDCVGSTSDCRNSETVAIDREYIDSVARKLHETGAIDDRVFPLIDMSKIYAFFESPLGQRACAAAARGELRKEKPFTMQVDYQGHQILVQGVIDCYFWDGDGYVLVDYKSNYVGRDTSKIEEQYREQLVLYKKALELGTGKNVAECYLYLFSRNMVLKVEV